MTELEPVTFPMAESAFVDCCAAYILANVSGSDVPKATKVMAVMASLSPQAQPKSPANSPTIAVTRPIKVKATIKASHPPQYFLGGTMAKNTFHPIEKKWKRASPGVTGSMLPSSSILGPRDTAIRNYYPHEGSSCVMKY